MSDFKSIPGGICAPKGFSAAGVHCGIRHNHSKLDLALIKADVRCAGAGCYTTNKVYGAPITVDREHLKDGYAQAIVVNSGNANTCAPNGVQLASSRWQHSGSDTPPVRPAWSRRFLSESVRTPPAIPDCPTAESAFPR